ncbi:hypothetical protein SODALDRAFT_288170 [Sodiomyces alkalinus F11]|uniref:Cyclin-dependent kinase n=1 Tax=Sodiomyces alkalinus (strain CBS 110278 / VKM F-3762 / F11) TaxID=1314773 RepID=A0A3N2Q7V2_SODAK|nr:hypothetical protein SODALDRAFT_288170 [Sodiomyces alkalinus F11]ROT42715.1 hypothetical protein SODALDRAFT_288170 [Sodiomyces alkalinus F11]
MSSPWQHRPEVVVDRVLKRAEVSKIARKLQNRLALAQFKTKHGWEDLAFDTIEPKLEEEMRRKKLSEGDVLSDSSSNTSDLPYPTKVLMSSPLKAPLFSDAIGSSGGTPGQRKRTYLASFDQQAFSSPSKRLRSSPTAYKSLETLSSLRGNHHHFTQSSPIKPRRQQHFTTSTGPDVSLYQSTRFFPHDLASSTLGPSDDEDDLPIHSFRSANVRSSPPTTPPMRNRGLPGPHGKDRISSNANGAKTGEEGADLLLYLATSPSPAMPSTRTRMEPPSTPPSKVGRDMALPSSHMTTPGGSNPFPNTPGQGFDFSDFVNITPSPAQKSWKTPLMLSTSRTPRGLARRRLSFESPLP